jgi:hypothetical protein
MSKKRPIPEIPEPLGSDLPSWVADQDLDRTTPYTEDELDLLVDGTLEGIHDTAAWKKLVNQVGEEEARRVLRFRIIMRDENARRLPRH